MATRDRHSLARRPARAVDPPRQGGRGNPNSTPPDPYKRCRLGPVPPRAWGWRQRSLKAAHHFVDVGLMPRMAFVACSLVLWISDEKGKDVDFYSIEQMGAQLGWAERTMAFWLAWLYDHGWLEKAHRCHRNERGEVRQLYNRWRPSRPAAAEEWLETQPYLRDPKQHGPKRKGGRTTPPKTTVERFEKPRRTVPEPVEAPPAPTAPRSSYAEVRKLVRTVVPHRSRRGPP